MSSSEAPTDAQLIAASRSDGDAFRVLYDRYAPALHGFFARRTRNDDAALDLTSETFAQAWLSRRRFRDLAGGSAAPWLFTIARRTLVRSVERSRIEQTARERLRLHAIPQITPVEEWLDGLDDALERALEALPAASRRAVELRVVEEHSYERVARELGCTPLAARIRVSRSLSRLRTYLEGGPA